MSKEYIIEFESGYDSFIIPDDSGAPIHEVHMIPWSSDRAHENSVVMNEQIMSGMLNEGDFLETYDAIYVKKDGRIKKVSKEAIFGDAIDRLIAGIDQLQCIEGFWPMWPSQKEQARRYLLSSLSLKVSYENEFRMPIFASFNYKSLEAREKIKMFITVSVTSDLWKETIGAIKDINDLI